MSDAEKMAQFRTLFSPNPMRSSSAQYYKWKLMDNPYGPGSISLEQREEKSVGSTTLTPKKVALYDEILPAAEILTISCPRRLWFWCRYTRPYWRYRQR